MIEVSAIQGLLVYLGLMGLGLGAAVAWDAWRARRQEWQVSNERLVRCTRCSCAFIAERTRRETDCPRCGARLSVGGRGGRSGYQEQA